MRGIEHVTCARASEGVGEGSCTQPNAGEILSGIGAADAGQRYLAAVSHVKNIQLS